MDDPFDDQHFWAALVILGSFAGAARLISQWDTRPLVNKVGSFMASVVVSVVAGLVLWEPLHNHPAGILAVAAAAGWFGEHAMTGLARMILMRRLGMDVNGRGNGGRHD